VESGEKLRKKEEAKDACARPHSGIRLYVINEVNKVSSEEEDNDERNRTNNEMTTNDNKEASMEVVVSLCPPPTIARVALVLRYEEVSC